MPKTLINYTNSRLQPAQYPENARTAAGKFGVSQTIAAGTVIAKKTSDGLLYPYAAAATSTVANATTAPTLGTATTGGSLAAGTYYVKYTWKDAAGQTTASAEASQVVPAGTSTNTVTVATPSLASGATGINVFVATVSGGEVFVGTAATNAFTITALPNPGAAAPPAVNTTGGPATDGTQTAVGLNIYDIQTDSAGLVYFGGSTTASPLNVPMPTSPIYVGGVFDTADLTGWDAAAATSMNARTLHNGFVDIPL